MLRHMLRLLPLVLLACATGSTREDAADAGTTPNAESAEKTFDVASPLARIGVAKEALAGTSRLVTIDGAFRLADVDATPSPWRSNGLAIRVSAPTSADGAMRLESEGVEGFWAELRARDLAHVEGRVRGRAVVFEGVARDVDLVHVLARGSAEDVRVVRSARDLVQARWSLRVGPNVAEVRVREGRVELADARGFVHLQSAPAFAVDAVGMRRSVHLQLARDGRDWSLVATLDAKGLVAPIALDPVWSAAAPMSAAPDGPAVALQDGRVAVFDSAATDLYDPGTNTWASTTPAPFAVVANGAAVLSDGRVLVAAGPSSSIALFSPTTNTWATAASSSIPGPEAIVAFGDRKLLAFGYPSNPAAPGTTGFQVYDGATDSWGAVADYGGPVSGIALAYLPSIARVLYAGGRYGYLSTTPPDPTAGLWDPASNASAGVFYMANARASANAFVLPSGRCLVGGGFEPAGPTAEFFDPVAKNWSAAPAPPFDAAWALLTTSRILTTSSDTTSATRAALYDDTRGAWLATSPLPSPQYSARLEPLPNGRALVFGGSDATYHPLASTQIFSPLPNGTTCSNPGDCQSGNCVDGVCCDTACTGQCQACALTGKEGTCSPVTGAPVGGRPVCSGIGAGTSCGASCNGTDGAACHFPSATTACGANTCSGGVETVIGTCDGAGACTAAARPCGTYACGATACLTSCTADVDCANGSFCNTGVCVPDATLGQSCMGDTQCQSGHCTDGVCCTVGSCGTGSHCAGAGPSAGQCQKSAGVACTAAADCASGHCVDGLCCDTACGGQCEACDVKGSEGTCSPVVGAPHGARMACDALAQYDCAKSTCDGATRDKCNGFANGTTTPCGADACTASGDLQKHGACDGKGSCAMPASTSCDGFFACDPATTACRTSCAADADCSATFRCDVPTGKCVQGAQCSADRSQSIDKTGVALDCTPYVCGGDGTCLKACATNDDCVAGARCDAATHACVTPIPDSGGHSGCSLDGRGDDRAPTAALLVGLVAALSLGRRRRR